MRRSSLPDLVEKAKPSVIRVSSATSTGTGFIYDGQRGFAVTNAHVMGGSTYVQVENEIFSCGAKLVGRDDVVDLAVIWLLGETDEYQSIDLADSDYVRQGDDVVAVGYPLGGVLRRSSAITVGHISSTGHSGVVSYLQTDAAINPGNSGGPLLNADGDVVGIVSSRIHQHGEDAVQGIGLAIASRELIDRIRRLELGICVRETFNNWLYNYSFDIPEGWHPNAIEDLSSVTFSTDDNNAHFSVHAVDLEDEDIEDSHDGLKVFSEWVMANAMDSFDSSDDFELELFEARYRYIKGRYRYIIKFRDHENGTHDIYLCELSPNFEQFAFGVYVRSYVFDDHLLEYDADRHSMLDSFRF